MGVAGMRLIPGPSGALRLLGPGCDWVWLYMPSTLELVFVGPDSGIIKAGGERGPVELGDWASDGGDGAVLR